MRKFRDRSDGYLVKHKDPIYKIIPFIMKDRNDAQVFFEDRVYLAETEKLLRKLRKEGHKVGFLHVVMAAMIRTASQKPKINRFVSARKIYARKDISFSIAIKKDMNEDTPETTIKLSFQPEDTLYDVIEVLNGEIEKNKNIEVENNTDITAKILSYMPGFLIRISLGFITFLDNRRVLPKFMLDLSPFHSSIFITDLGSLGIKSVYHHIYNFGTNTIFVSFGVKTKEQKFDKESNFENLKAMDLKIVADERVVDGYYFASGIKLFKKIIETPEVLLDKPESIVKDDEI